jgi:hypothetical protein
MVGQAPVHEQVLEAASRVADARRSFKLRDVVAALPHLNPGTVRTHVVSRCCVNAPAHHQTRWRYFRALGKGIYRLERAVAPGPAARRRRRGWQDRILDAVPSSIDETLIVESLKRTPTERLEHMRAAAMSLEEMRRR